MNKNIIKLFAIVMMIFMIGAVLVACGGSKGDQGDPGTPGAPGVQGEKGEQGPAGHSAYIGENGNWFYYNDEAGKWIDSGVSAEGVVVRPHCEDGKHPFVYKEWPDERHDMNSDGLALGVCPVCGYAEWATIGHEWVKGETVAPTCLAEGYTVYTCYCGAVKHADTTEKVDCVPGEKTYAIKEPGFCECEWTNAWWIKCTVCGDTLEEGADGAREHSYTVKEPIIPELGSDLCNFREGYRWVCDNCDCPEHIKYEYTGEIRGHAVEEFDPALTKIENGKVTLAYVCDNCNIPQTTTVDLADCKVEVAPTCTVDGSVTYVYNYKLDGVDKSIVIIPTEVLPATGHKNTEVVKGHDASCGLPGLTDGEVCKDCGATTVEQVEIPAVGHNHGLRGEGSSKPYPEIIKVDGEYYKAYWCDVCGNWVAYELIPNYSGN